MTYSDDFFTITQEELWKMPEGETYCVQQCVDGKWNFEVVYMLNITNWHRRPIYLTTLVQCINKYDEVQEPAWPIRIGRVSRFLPKDGSLPVLIEVIKYKPAAT